MALSSVSAHARNPALTELRPHNRVSYARSTKRAQVKPLLIGVVHMIAIANIDIGEL